MTDFYQSQNVVVLGGAGFVGRHLCLALEERGAEVYVIDNLSRHESQRGQVITGHLHNADIRHYFGNNFSAIFNLLSNFNPFAVFNLAAAVAGVEYNQRHHNQMFLDNIQLQTIPVMVCETLGVSHFLQVSSACVYGEDANAPAIEYNLGGEPVGANAGYSWSKRMGERAVQWSNLQHAVIVRPSNIYGPGDWYDERAHVIPKLIKGYDEGTARRFEGGASREYIYVTDAADGMLHALEFGEHKEAYNLGCNSETVFGTHTLHSSIADLTGKPLAKKAKSAFEQGDRLRFSNGSKLAALGWSHKVRFSDGLQKTVEAYLE